MCAIFSRVSRGMRTKQFNICANFSRFSLGSKCGQVSLEWLETRTQESKQVCEFFGSLTRLEPTATEGVLWFTSQGTGVSTGGRAHSSSLFFGSTDQGVHDACARRIHDNAWICARRKTDHDVVCVSFRIRKKKRAKERGQK